MLILPANFVENPENLVKSIFSDDVLDKLSTLYLFLVIILFFFGGIVHFLEKGMQMVDRTKSTNTTFDFEEIEMSEEYIEDVKTSPYNQ